MFESQKDSDEREASNRDDSELADEWDRSLRTSRVDGRGDRDGLTSGANAEGSEAQSADAATDAASLSVGLRLSHQTVEARVVVALTASDPVGFSILLYE